MKVLILFIFMLSSLSLQAQLTPVKDSPQEFEKTIGETLVKIEVSTSYGKGNGTGFFVEPNLILTSFHVIKDKLFSGASISLENDQMYTTNFAIINFSMKDDLALLLVGSENINSSVNILDHKKVLWPPKF